MNVFITLAAALHLAFAMIATLALRESGETRPGTRLSILVVAWLLPLLGPLYVSCGLYANTGPLTDVHES